MRLYHQNQDYNGLFMIQPCYFIFIQLTKQKHSFCTLYPIEAGCQFPQNWKKWERGYFRLRATATAFQSVARQADPITIGFSSAFITVLKSCLISWKARLVALLFR